MKQENMDTIYKEVSRLSALISVVIPVYNTAKYLRRCMESIVNQTYRNLEIICVDDGSMDGSGEMLDAYAAQDNRIKVVHKENGGLVSARKAGVALATGDYVSYVDSDDEISMTRYEDLLDKGIAQRADIIFANVTYVYADGRHLCMENYFSDGFYDRDDITANVLTRLCDIQHFYIYQLRPYIWGVLLQRELIQVRQPEVDDAIVYGEDAACMMICLSRANRLYFTSAGEYFYHKNSDSMTHALETSETGRARVQKSNVALYSCYRSLLPRFPRNVRPFVMKELMLNVYYATLLFDYERLVDGLGE